MDEVQEQISQIEAQALQVHSRLNRIDRGISRRSARGRAVPPSMFAALDRCHGDLDCLCNRLNVLYDVRQEMDQSEHETETGYISSWQKTIDMLCLRQPVTELVDVDNEDDQQIFFIDDNDVDGNRSSTTGRDLHPMNQLSGRGFGLKEAINDTLTESLFASARP